MVVVDADFGRFEGLRWRNPLSVQRRILSRRRMPPRDNSITWLGQRHVNAGDSCRCGGPGPGLHNRAGDGSSLHLLSSSGGGPHFCGSPAAGPGLVVQERELTDARLQKNGRRGRCDTQERQMTRGVFPSYE